MRLVFGLVLLIGMGLAGFAVYMVKGYFDAQEVTLNQVRESAATAVVTVDVYSPTRAMTYGELITPEDVKLIRYAEQFLPAGVFKTEEELFPLGTSTPRVVTRPMEINEPIMAVKVTEPGAPRGITALLEPGMRAFPLSNRMTEAYAGELRIADLVDIYWIGSIDGGRAVSRLVKSRLEIIAMDEPDADGNTRGTGIILEVSQQDFADLQVLNSAGNLSVTPVGRTDTTEAVAIERDLDVVLDIQREEAPAPVEERAPDEKCYVSQGFGQNAVQIEIDCAKGGN